MLETSRIAAVAAPSQALPGLGPSDAAAVRPEDIMTRYTPRRPQAAPRWFVAVWLTATALITAVSAIVPQGAVH